MGTLPSIPSEMLRGHIDTIILLCLLDSDKHTAQIKEEIEKRAGGGFELKQGTFYSCLQRIVKQGYVTEYRTSNTPDGVRRKYYQLTEKGKLYIDENKDRWEYSRHMINALIQTPEPDTEVSEKPKDKSKPTISNGKPDRKKHPQEEITSVTEDNLKPVAIQTASEDEQPDEDLSPETALNEFLSSLGSEDNNPSNPFDKKQDKEQEQTTSVSIEREVARVDSTHSSRQKKADNSPLNYDLFTYMDYTQSDYFPETEASSDGEKFSKERGDSPRVEEKIERSRVRSSEDVTQEIAPSESTAPIIEVPDKKKDKFASLSTETRNKSADLTKKERETPIFAVVSSEKPGEKNDTFTEESVSSPDYKSVLSKLFNASEEKKDEPVREADYTENFDIEEFFRKDERNHEDKRIVETSRASKRFSSKKTPARRYSDPPAEKRSSAASVTTVHHPYYDFSDIQSMADREGFKVKISSRENVKESGMILLNKLVFHSSVLFFLIIAIECLVMYFATAAIAKLDFLPFGIFIAVTALFPLTTFILFIVNKDRMVSKIASFKSAIELLAVIMLNLLLIIIVCCVLTNLDFSDQTSIMRFIVYPVFLVLNLPVYTFIKYLKLDKDKYFN